MKVQNVTFKTWLKNHEDDHKDKWYRELYPFNVIKDIDFSEENIDKLQTINFSAIKYFVTIKSIEFQENKRYKATFEILTHPQSKSQEWKNRKWDNIFQIVYDEDYNFITIFTKKEDPSKELVEKFMKGNFSKITKNKSIPISELLIRTLILHIAEDIFSIGKHREVFKMTKEGTRQLIENPFFKLKNHNSLFAPIYSIDRKVWVCYAFNEEKAHRLGFIFSNQCEKLFVIYANPTYTRHHRCTYIDTDIISLFDFANSGTSEINKVYDKHIRFIQNHLNEQEHLDQEELLNEIEKPKREKYEIKKSELMEAFAFLRVLPKNNEDLFHSLCCFNLINTFLKEKGNSNIKRKEKKKFKNMYFFKTYLADILTKRVENRDYSLPIYLTKELLIIEIFDFQFSFQSVPLNTVLKKFIKSEFNKEIIWKGIRLQPIAPLLLNYSRSLRMKNKKSS